MTALRQPGELLDFWFSERVRPLWFEPGPGFDAEIRERFAATLDAAATGLLAGWLAAAESALALVILLDQFPRNIHRGTPRAFACDASARSAADSAVLRGFDQRTPLDRRPFFYLPFEHSEEPADQRRAVALFRAWLEAQDAGGRNRAEEQFRYVLRHQEIIERFGRFPHRNRILGRETTAAEAAFLDEPMSSF